jgi:hypothetical protein
MDIFNNALLNVPPKKNMILCTPQILNLRVDMMIQYYDKIKLNPEGESLKIKHLIRMIRDTILELEHNSECYKMARSKIIINDLTEIGLILLSAESEEDFAVGNQIFDSLKEIIVS